MAQFAVPPMPPPTAPREGADPNEISLWARRISGYLGSLNLFIEEVGDAYIANTVQLASDLITADQITSSAVTSAKIADSAVTSVKIQDGAVITQDLGDSAVTTIKIADLAVTTGKLIASAITSNELQNSAVTVTKIENSSITSVKLIDSAITSIKLENSAVTNTELVTVTIDSATAHAAMGTSVLVTFSISRDKVPLVSPSCSSATWLVSLATVSTSTVTVQAYNAVALGPISATVSITYY